MTTRRVISCASRRPYLLHIVARPYVTRTLPAQQEEGLPFGMVEDMESRDESVEEAEFRESGVSYQQEDADQGAVDPNQLRNAQLIEKITRAVTLDKEVNEV